MLTLIKREIEDHIVFFIIAIILITIYLPIVIYAVLTPMRQAELPIGIPGTFYAIFGSLLPFPSLIAAALGATQMYSDRSKKISTFLATMATTRSRILTAKVIVGMLWILVVFVPIAAADAILLKAFPRIAPIDLTLLVKLFVTAFLACSACYCVGLQMGWNQNKFFPILGAVGLSPILLSLIIITGFGVETAIILLLLILASMVRTWRNFMSTPL